MFFADDEQIDEQVNVYGWLRLSSKNISSFRGKSSIVKYLYLRQNQLDSFSIENGDFPKLEGLYLSENQLVSFSANEEYFPNIKCFDLHSNLLRAVAFKGVFLNLVTLDLSDNHLTSLSIEGSLPNLVGFILSFNQLTSFPFKGVFPNLTLFNISHNPYIEVLEFSAPKLQQLHIRGTKIRFLEKSLVGKVIDVSNIKPYEHPPGTKELVTRAFHEGNPIVGEILEHLTR